MTTKYLCNNQSAVRMFLNFQRTCFKPQDSHLVQKVFSQAAQTIQEWHGKASPKHPKDDHNLLNHDQYFAGI